MNEDDVANVFSVNAPGDLILAASYLERPCSPIVILEEGNYQSEMVAEVQAAIKTVMMAGTGLVDLEEVMSGVRTKANRHSTLGVSALTRPT